MSDLRLEGRFGRGDFVGKVELEVRAGEVLAVLGPNGAGKSSLLRTVAGFDPVHTGRLILGDHVLDDGARRVPPEERRVGTVFQDHRLFPHLTTLENIAFGLRTHGWRKAAAAHEASTWLERLGVAHLATHRPHALSGGEAQRVALARTLAADPRALVLDEPLAALDVRVRTEVRALLAEHLAAFAGPCLLVTHDAADALALADRLVVLEDGRVVQDGTIHEVAAAPGTDYVARVLRGAAR